MYIHVGFHLCHVTNCIWIHVHSTSGVGTLVFEDNKTHAVVCVHWIESG